MSSSSQYSVKVYTSSKIPFAPKKNVRLVNIGNLTPNMNLARQIFMSPSGITFFSDGKDYHLFPLKKGTPDFVWVENNNVSYVYASLHRQEQQIKLFRNEYYIEPDGTPGSLESIRTIHDKLVYTKVYYTNFIYESPKSIVSKSFVVGIGVWDDPLYEFIKHWVLDMSLDDYEYQYTDASKFSLIASTMHTAVNTSVNYSAQEYSTICNFSYRLQLEANEFPT